MEYMRYREKIGKYGLHLSSSCGCMRNITQTRLGLHAHTEESPVNSERRQWLKFHLLSDQLNESNPVPFTCGLGAEKQRKMYWAFANLRECQNVSNVHLIYIWWKLGRFQFISQNPTSKQESTTKSAIPLSSVHMTRLNNQAMHLGRCIMEHSAKIIYYACKFKSLLPRIMLMFWRNIRGAMRYRFWKPEPCFHGFTSHLLRPVKTSTH